MSVLSIFSDSEFAVGYRIRCPESELKLLPFMSCWKPRLFMRALCHMAFGSIQGRLLDNLNISQRRQITTLVESSGLPPRTNGSIKHPARPGMKYAHASYHGDMEFCLFASTTGATRGSGLCFLSALFASPVSMCRDLKEGTLQKMSPPEKKTNQRTFPVILFSVSLKAL